MTRPLPMVGKSPMEATWQDRRALDLLAKRYCFLRAGAELKRVGKSDSWVGPCERCQRVQVLSWCHILTRGAWRVRWDFENFYAWCAGCHRYLDQHWDEKHDWIVKRIGADRFLLLRVRKKGTGTMDLKGKRILIEREIAKLEAA